MNCRAMEQSVFPRPEVLRELQNYVEVRLHTDTNPDLRDLQEKRLHDTSMPIYEIVDPGTGETLDVRKGADPPLTGGRQFREFLARNSRKKSAP